MKAHQFNRLVANLKRDGALTSLPLVYRDVVLSGNHRVRAARKAGIERILVLEIVSDISEERARAVALSHNAIAGEDDPNTLAALYESLPYDEKLYSGLSDDDLRVEELDLASLSVGATAYQEIVVTFLPEDADVFEQLVKRLGAEAKKPNYVAALVDFDRFFDTLVAVKHKRNVFNTAHALRIMAELAAERLEQLNAEHPQS